MGISTEERNTAIHGNLKMNRFKTTLGHSTAFWRQEGFLKQESSALRAADLGSGELFRIKHLAAEKSVHEMKSAVQHEPYMEEHQRLGKRLDAKERLRARAGKAHHEAAINLLKFAATADTLIAELHKETHNGNEQISLAAARIEPHH